MEVFEETEKLYRAVLPPSRNKYLWTKDGSRLSSIAFRNRKNEVYVSVDRQSSRSNEECIEDIQSRLQGAIVSVTCKRCWDSSIKIIPHPNKRDPWHCGLINDLPGSATTELSDIQCQNLADFASIEFKDF